MGLGLHTAVAWSEATFVDAINVKNNVKKTKKWYFLQTIVFRVLNELFKHEKEYSAKNLSRAVWQSGLHVRADTLQCTFWVTSPKPL